jgi:hypothetical protein
VPAVPSTLDSLRHLLAERFPAAPRPAGHRWATGVPAIDTVTGGLPRGAVTEVVCSTPSCGGHLLFARLLADARATRQRVALVEAADGFDPDSFDPDATAHLLWVRADSVDRALQATDLLLRDANVPLVLLDLRDTPEAARRRVPTTLWYRLQRAAAPHDVSLLVETPRSLVPCASLRVELHRPHAFEALVRERDRLARELQPAIQRTRAGAVAASAA